MVDLAVSFSASFRVRPSQTDDARLKDAQPASGADRQLPASATGDVQRAPVNAADQAAARRGAVGAEAGVRGAIESRLPGSSPTLDRSVTQAAQAATAAVAQHGGPAERDQLRTMDGLRQRMLEAGGGSLAGYLRNKETAAANADRAAESAPASDMARAARARDFANEDLAAARMKVALVQAGYGQLADGNLSMGDKAAITDMTALVMAQQARVEALR